MNWGKLFQTEGPAELNARDAVTVLTLGCLSRDVSEPDRKFRFISFAETMLDKYSGASP